MELKCISCEMPSNRPLRKLDSRRSACLCREGPTVAKLDWGARLNDTAAALDQEKATFLLEK